LSRYGIDYYNAAYYGANTLSDFNAKPFLAIPYDYQSIRLTWVTPSGGWDYLRLVRNSYGFPITADDGDVLFEDGVASSRIVYIDKGQTPNNIKLKPGHAYYYSIYVRETVHSTWQVAANTVGISVKDYNTLSNMYNSLPTILTSQVPYDASVEQSNDILYRFLKIFAVSLDLYKTQTENILNRYDITNLNGILIPILMRQFGMKYEPELGLKQSRVMLNNAIRLYKNKGSKLGLKEYVKAYAGYDSTVVMGKNLMLDQNDSSFEQTIGSWASISNATLARHLAADSPTIAPYAESTAQSDFPNLQKATLEVTASGSGTVEIALSGDSPIHYGIPVSASTVYSFSGYSQAATTARSVSSFISWYDRFGTFISNSTTGTGVTNTAGGWRRFYNTATSPATAYFAVPHIQLASATSSEKHYFDALQFEANSSVTTFQEARQIKITLRATRINELLNPNFEVNTNNWTATNGTLLLDSTEVEPGDNAPSVNISGGSAEIYSSASGLVTLASSARPVFSGNDYTFSIYVYTEVGSTVRAVTPYISWYNGSSTLISTTTGTPVTSVIGSWLRPFVTSTAPSTAVTAKVGFTWTAPGAGYEINVDAALFEKSSFVNSFFDGSHGVANLSDLFWEGGSVNNGRSHYYLNRFAVQSRLVKTIPDWITLGSTFELFLAQPGT
jgi:hypothetical protein